MKRTLVIAGKFLMVPFPRSSAAMVTTITAWMIGGADWSEADKDGLVKFMCEGKNFSEDRIRSGTKRLAKARGGQTQMRMDSFFKVSSEYREPVFNDKEGIEYLAGMRAVQTYLQRV